LYFESQVTVLSIPGTEEQVMIAHSINTGMVSLWMLSLTTPGSQVVILPWPKVF